MPTPKKGESRESYIGRCIPTVLKEGTAKDNKQAAAICFSMWKQHHKHSKGDTLIEGMIDEVLKNKNKDKE